MKARVVAKDFTVDRSSSGEAEVQGPAEEGGMMGRGDVP